MGPRRGPRRKRPKFMLSAAARADYFDNPYYALRALIDPSEAIVGDIERINDWSKVERVAWPVRCFGAVR